jgi:pimeloyl-ACP methyl ester carboxylesterase
MWQSKKFKNRIMKTLPFRKILILLFLALLSSNISFAIRPDTTIVYTPNNYGLHYTEYDFYTSDNLRLKGWLIPFQDYVQRDTFSFFRKNPIENRDLSSNDKPTVILCNGDGGNMSYTIWEANEFIAAGFNVFMFDWRGFGHSQSWELKKDFIVLPEYLIDYDAAIDFVYNLPQLDSANIFAYGYSTGFYLTFGAALKNPNLKAIAGRALITNLTDLVRCVSKLPKNKDREIIIPDNYPEKLLPINGADNLDVPIFMVVGENDDRTPLWMSLDVFKQIKSPKELKIYGNSGHCDIEVKNMDFYYKNIGAFFYKHLESKTPAGNSGE